MISTFTRSEACALKTLFEILSGPLPVIPSHIPSAEKTNRDRWRLWWALDHRVKVRSRSLIELEHSPGAIRRGSERGMSSRSIIFLLKLETKTGQPDMSAVEPPVAHINITMKLVCDPPEWHVREVHLSEADASGDRLLLEGLDQYEINNEAV